MFSPVGRCGYICLHRLLWCHKQDRKKGFYCVFFPPPFCTNAQLWIGPDTKRHLRTKSLLAAFRNCFQGAPQLTTDWRVSGKMRHLCLRLNVVVIAVKWLGQAWGERDAQSSRGNGSTLHSAWLKMEDACSLVRKTFPWASHLSPNDVMHNV